MYIFFFPVPSLIMTIFGRNVYLICESNLLCFDRIYAMNHINLITYCCLCILIVRPCILIVVYIFLLFVHVFLSLSMYASRCLCILIVVYVYLLLSMYSYCCLCILIIRPCILIVVYVYLLLFMYS